MPRRAAPLKASRGRPARASLGRGGGRASYLGGNLRV